MHIFALYKWKHASQTRYNVLVYHACRLFAVKPVCLVRVEISDSEVVVYLSPRALKCYFTHAYLCSVVSMGNLLSKILRHSSCVLLKADCMSPSIQHIIVNRVTPTQKAKLKEIIQGVRKLLPNLCLMWCMFKRITGARKAVQCVKHWNATKCVGYVMPWA